MQQFLDDFIVSRMGAKNDDERLLFQFLSRSWRSGYTCIRVVEDAFVPDPHQFFEESIDCKALLQAFFSLESVTPYIVKENDKLYFTYAHELQESVKNLYLEKSKEQESSEVIERITLFALLKESQGKISQEQARAIVHMASSGLTLICGGPGTGKSYTASQFVRAYIEAKAPEKIRICLAGPTGKSAQLLLQGVQRELGDGFNEHIEAKTIHALLEIRSFKAPKKSSLPYHVIIVDEVSMLDMNLAQQLLERCRDVKLLFLGDPYQLPPVEPGDALELFKEIEQERKNYIELVECKRIEAPRILELAKALRNKDSEAMRHVLMRSDKELSFIPFQDDILERALPQLVANFEIRISEDFMRLPFVILSPCVEGPFGVEHINRALFSRTQRELPVPIIVTKNNYDLGVMNGEMGIEYKGELSFSNGRRIPSKMLRDKQLGFSITIHKSQGSEFDHVLLILPPHQVHVDPRMLYTAVTRAKKNLQIWGHAAQFSSIFEKERATVKR